MVTKTFTFEGKRYYVRAQTEHEAIVKMTNRRRDLADKKAAVNGSMTVREWALQAIETYKTNQKPITRKSVLQVVKHCILAEIGDMPLKSVNAIRCQQVLNMQKGKSKYTISQVYFLLKFIFSKAKVNHLIQEDPTLDLVRPLGTKTYRRAMTEKEERAFLEVSKNDKFILFLLMYYCSCRPAEAKECTGKDITIVQGVPMLHIRGTKTVNADRYVPIPQVLYARIKDTPKFDYISTTEGGNKHGDKSYRRLTNRLYREMNIAMGCRVYRNQLISPFPLPDDFSPYCLRHTFCTNLQKRGVDIRTAQRLMGHADIRMTANIYTHVDMDEIVKASKLMDI